MRYQAIRVTNPHYLSNPSVISDEAAAQGNKEALHNTPETGSSTDSSHAPDSANLRSSTPAYHLCMVTVSNSTPPVQRKGLDTIGGFSIGRCNPVEELVLALAAVKTTNQMARRQRRLQICVRANTPGSSRITPQNAAELPQNSFGSTNGSLGCKEGPTAHSRRCLGR